MAALNHPDVAQIYRIEESGPRALVVEFVPGRPCSVRPARLLVKIVLLDQAQQRFETEDRWWRKQRDAKELFVTEFDALRQVAAAPGIGSLTIDDALAVAATRAPR